MLKTQTQLSLNLFHITSGARRNHIVTKPTLMLLRLSHRIVQVSVLSLETGRGIPLGL